MSNLLDSYRSLLSHYQDNVVQDLKDKVLGNTSEKASEQVKEDTSIKSTASSFTSLGVDSLTRHYQAKELYGMECNATTVMYILQSYGLIPPKMTRQEFEIAFTPLYTNEKKGKNQYYQYIHVGNTLTTAKPFDIFTPILDDGYFINKSATFINSSVGYTTITEAILRGANSIDGSPLRSRLGKIIENFKYYGNYDARLRHVLNRNGHVHKNSINDNTKFDIVSLIAKLKAGNISNKYFIDGNTIMIGITYHYPYDNVVGHYVPIVNNFIDKIIVDSQEHYIYPIDDPWYGGCYVLASYISTDKIVNLKTNKKITIKEDISGDIYYNNNKLMMIASDYAIGINE